MAAIQLVNPRRRRKRSSTRKRTTPKRRRRRAPVKRYYRSARRTTRRRRRNPRGLFGRMNVAGLPLGEAFGIGTGVIGTEVLTQQAAAFVPPMLSAGPGRLLLKGGVTLGGAMLLRAFRQGGLAKSVVLGGTIGVLLDAYNMYVAPMLPGGNVGTSGYVLSAGGVSGYVPAGSGLSDNLYAPIY